ncbi:MAG: hypothetical protein E3J72_15140 [Planctomycetota bacterium]|nr:MAG: hypothetical protein E3J72_15140 [Planctomycetota bacterium]
MTGKIPYAALLFLAALIISTQTGCVFGLVSKQRYGPNSTNLKSNISRSKLLQEYGGPDKVIKGEEHDGKREDIYIYRRISGIQILGLICYTSNWDLIAVVQGERVTASYSAQKGRGWTILGFITLPIPPPILVKME